MKPRRRRGPDQARKWLNRGLALAKLGRHAEALACVERALVLDPQIPHGAAACEKLRARVR
jgi:tetratricopeptide (TPR) repeat protein